MSKRSFDHFFLPVSVPYFNLSCFSCSQLITSKVSVCQAHASACPSGMSGLKWAFPHQPSLFWHFWQLQLTSTPTHCFSLWSKKGEEATLNYGSLTSTPATLMLVKSMLIQYRGPLHAQFLPRKLEAHSILNKVAVAPFTHQKEMKDHVGNQGPWKIETLERKKKQMKAQPAKDTL